MKITVDTNILVRAVVRDNEIQSRAAAKVLKHAEVVAVSLTSLCEFVWVLRSVYKFGKQEISAALEALLEAENVVVNRQAVAAGLRVLNAGGDLADGLIEYEGRWLGGDTFVSFDRKAVAAISKEGLPARLLG